MIAGIVVGILGVEGWIGFLPHFASQLLVRFLGKSRGCARHALGLSLQPLPWMDLQCNIAARLYHA